MSNFQATVGRSVQFVASDGVTICAAIITKITGGVNLTVFLPDGTSYSLEDVKEYVDTFDARRISQPNTYRLHWVGR